MRPISYVVLVAVKRTNRVRDDGEIILGTQCVALHVQRVSCQYVMAPSLLAVLEETAEFHVLCTAQL